MRQLVQRKQEIEGGIEFLEKQIEILEATLEMRKIDYHKTNGALHEVNRWIEQLKEEVEAELEDRCNKHFATEQDIEGMDQ